MNFNFSLGQRVCSWRSILNGLLKAVIGMAAYRAGSAFNHQHSRSLKRRKYKKGPISFPDIKKLGQRPSFSLSLAYFTETFRDAATLACASSLKSNATKNPHLCRRAPRKAAAPWATFLEGGIPAASAAFQDLVLKGVSGTPEWCITTRRLDATGLCNNLELHYCR